MATTQQLNANIDKLIQVCENLKQEKTVLGNAKTMLEKTVEDQQGEIRELHRQIEMLKMAKSLAGTEGKTTDAKLKINELVREIDKCISLLNK